MIPRTVTHLCFVSHYANDVSFFLPALILSPPSRLEKVASTWKWNAPCCYLFMKMKKKVRVCSSTKCSGASSEKCKEFQRGSDIGNVLFIYLFYRLPCYCHIVWWQYPPSNVCGALNRKIKEIYYSVIYFDVREYKPASTSFCLPVLKIAIFSSPMVLKEISTTLSSRIDVGSLLHHHVFAILGCQH